MYSHHKTENLSSVLPVVVGRSMFPICIWSEVRWKLLTHHRRRPWKLLKPNKNICSHVGFLDLPLSMESRKQKIGSVMSKSWSYDALFNKKTHLFWFYSLLTLPLDSFLHLLSPNAAEHRKLKRGGRGVQIHKIQILPVWHGIPVELTNWVPPFFFSCTDFRRKGRFFAVGSRNWDLTAFAAVRNEFHAGGMIIKRSLKSRMKSLESCRVVGSTEDDSGNTRIRKRRKKSGEK